MIRSKTMSVAAIAGALALAACGSSSYSNKGSSANRDTKAAGPVALSGPVNDKGSTDISAKGAEATLKITAGDNSFDPTFVKAAPGATVSVDVTNSGTRVHTFTLDDGSVDQTLQPGESATVKVTVPTSGSLRFSCNFHEKMGMQGAFDSSSATGNGGSTTTSTASSSRGGSGY